MNFSFEINRNQTPQFLARAVSLLSFTGILALA